MLVNMERVVRGKKKASGYGTKQVSVILGIPEWRVKNFSEGEAYRMPPSVRAGSGRGSRRLYGWADIFRIGLADQLVGCGFNPETVGRAVREIPESLFRPYQAILYAEGRPEPTLTRNETPLLVNDNGEWRVRMSTELESILSRTLEHEGSSHGLFVINLANVFDTIFAGLGRYFTGMSRDEWEAGLKGG
jgi:hypothetical protein